MNRDDLRKRTKDFALRIIRMVASLPRSTVSNVIGKQVLRSGTSIGANYREALRASSRKHFASTVAIVLREADETLYWLDLLADANIVKPGKLSLLRKEADELIAIFAATLKKTKSQIPNPKSLLSC